MRRAHKAVIVVKQSQRDSVRALKIAGQNWQQQREPADVRVYWRAARAAQRATATEPAMAQLTHWLTLSRYEDATLADAPQ